MAHYESTPFNAKPIEMQEEPDNLVFPDVDFLMIIHVNTYTHRHMITYYMPMVIPHVEVTTP